MLQCRHCGAEISLGEPIPRDAECPACGRDLRACVQCRHYDVAYHNACRETEADPVVEKVRRNFCEFFSFSREPFRAAQGGRSSEAKAALEKLFGGSAATREEDPKRRLERLFRPDPEG